METMINDLIMQQPDSSFPKMLVLERQINVCYESENLLLRSSSNASTSNASDTPPVLTEVRPESSRLSKQEKKEIKRLQTATKKAEKAMTMSSKPIISGGLTEKQISPFLLDALNAHLLSCGRKELTPEEIHVLRVTSRLAGEFTIFAIKTKVYPDPYATLHELALKIFRTCLLVQSPDEYIQCFSTLPKAKDFGEMPRLSDVKSIRYSIKLNGAAQLLAHFTFNNISYILIAKKTASNVIPLLDIDSLGMTGVAIKYFSADVQMQHFWKLIHAKWEDYKSLLFSFPERTCLSFELHGDGSHIVPGSKENRRATLFGAMLPDMTRVDRKLLEHSCEEFGIDHVKNTFIDMSNMTVNEKCGILESLQDPTSLEEGWMVICSDGSLFKYKGLMYILLRAGRTEAEKLKGIMTEDGVDTIVNNLHHRLASNAKGFRAYTGIANSSIAIQAHLQVLHDIFMAFVGLGISYQDLSCTPRDVTIENYGLGYYLKICIDQKLVIIPKFPREYYDFATQVSYLAN